MCYYYILLFPGIVENYNIIDPLIFPTIVDQYSDTILRALHWPHLR